MSVTLLECHLSRRRPVSLFYSLNSHVCPTFISFTHSLTFFPEVFFLCDSWMLVYVVSYFFDFFRLLSLHSLVFPCKGGITITFHFCCNQSNRTDYWWREELVSNRFIKLHSATTFYYGFLLHVLFSQMKQ